MSRWPETKPRKLSARAEERRQRVLDAARELFTKHGYEEAAIEAIARRAGFSKRTVYLDFPSKHELFSAVLAPELDSLKARLDAARSPTGTGWEQARALATAYAEFALESPELFELVMTFERRDAHRGGSAPKPGPYTRRCRKLNEEMSRMRDAALERGLADGSVRSGLAVEQLNLLLWASLAGILTAGIERGAVLELHYRIPAGELVERFLDRMLPRLEGARVAGSFRT